MTTTTTLMEIDEIAALISPSRPDAVRTAAYASIGQPDRELSDWAKADRDGKVLAGLRKTLDAGISAVVIAEHPELDRRLRGTKHNGVLWVQGDESALHKLDGSVAIVGARAATGYGEHVAMELAAGLAVRDRVVISGGAYGIDGMAHRAALASRGGTIAVLAGGLDRLYPAGHEALLRRIANTEGCLLASTTLADQPPTQARFLDRNSIIAGLADATVIVEAGRRSGSMNTYGWAKQLGRPVGAVPGPITSAASAGTNSLLNGDATPILGVEDAANLTPPRF